MFSWIYLCAGLGRAVQLLYGWELSLCEDNTWRTNSVQLLSGSTL